MLAFIKGLSEAKVEKIKEAVAKVSGDANCFKTALNVKHKRENVFKITTGSNAVE